MFYTNAYFDDAFEFDDDEALESQYRRAYRDGWLGALDALDALTEGPGGVEAVHERLFVHWDGALYEWGEDDCRSRQQPPAMPGTGEGA